jgi:UDP-N-acetyl-2-amino-2-deoxyglucuronate dehydrogenase
MNEHAVKRFAMTGVAGYIAPRHLQAIKETGNVLIAACDPHDSVGILDRYFADVAFFSEFERFDRHLDKLRRVNRGIDYLTICSPNNLHDAHIRLALRLGADAICEKPLVLNPWNLDALEELEQETGKRVYTILQLRVHPTLIGLHQQLQQTRAGAKHDVCLSYVTSRGPWYRYSWKGSNDRSGGVGTNIGIHFFDLLLWLFGSAQSSEVYLSECDRMGGCIELERARVTWFLSIDRADLPADAVAKDKPTYRSITVDGQELEFSEGFADLHTRVYEQTLANRGFGIAVARPSIELAYQIRTAAVVPVPSDAHPFLRKGEPVR